MRANITWISLLLLPCLAIARPYPTGIVPPTNTQGNGGTFVFAFQPDSVTLRPISTVYMAIETSPGSDGCYFSYWPQSNSIYLADQAGNAVGPMAPGTSGVLQNAQCSIAGSRSYASPGPGGEWNVGISVTFTNSMPQGTKPLWSAALDGVDSSGWVKNIGGFYCIRVCSPAAQPPPNSETFAPSTRTGIYESFAFEFSDANGAFDIDTATILINGPLDSRDACNLTFDPQAAGGGGVLYFVTDPGPGGQVTIATIFPGNVATSGSNNQCEVRGENVSVSRVGAILRLSISINMKGSGAKQIFMAAQDLQGGNSGWASRGTWYAAASFDQISRLNPNCGNAFSCTEYSGIFPINYTSNPSQPSLQLGPIKLNNVTRTSATISYSEFRVETRRLGGCPNPFPIGESTGSPAFGNEVGSAYTQGTVTETLLTPVITRLLSDQAFGPGFYYFRVSFKISARNPSTPNQTPVVSVHSVNSDCVRAGFAPQITGIRDDTTGLQNEIERGGSGDGLQIYGNNVQGTFVPSGSAISPNTGISQWAVTSVTPASGQVNLSYSVQSSAPTGQRSVTLSNSIGASPPWALFWITDPSPQITSVTPDRPWQPGETITVQINGKGFGSDPTVTLRATDSDTIACLGSDSVSIVGPVPGTARDTQITFTKSVPQNAVTCNFEIEITSRGLSGSFSYAPKSPPKVESITARGSKGGLMFSRTIVFIVHGISDSPSSFTNLRDSLYRLPEWGPDAVHNVDVGFSFQDCASISVGAMRLANHVLSSRFRQGDRFAFIGHSMGGLIIRRMLALNLINEYALNLSPPQPALPVVGLVTLGTPHLGYPFLNLDLTVPGKCNVQSQEMESHLDKDLLGTATLDPATMLSPFLAQLRLDWNINQVRGKWFAIGGRACNAADRFAGTPGNRNGCRASSNPASDSVVCLDSAVTMYPDLYQGFFPTLRFLDPDREYQHGVYVGEASVLNVLCGEQNPAKASLTNPIFGSPLFDRIRDFLNAL